MGPRAGLDGCGKSRLTGIRFPDRAARRDSLYRLSYCGPREVVNEFLNITYVWLKYVLRRVKLARLELSRIPTAACW